MQMKGGGGVDSRGVAVGRVGVTRNTAEGDLAYW